MRLSVMIARLFNRPAPVSAGEVLEHLSLTELDAYGRDLFSVNSIVRQRRGDKILYDPKDRVNHKMLSRGAF